MHTMHADRTQTAARHGSRPRCTSQLPQGPDLHATRQALTPDIICTNGDLLHTQTASSVREASQRHGQVLPTPQPLHSLMPFTCNFLSSTTSTESLLLLPARCPLPHCSPSQLVCSQPCRRQPRPPQQRAYAHHRQRCPCRCHSQHHHPAGTQGACVAHPAIPQHQEEVHGQLEH